MDGEESSNEENRDEEEQTADREKEENQHCLAIGDRTEDLPVVRREVRLRIEPLQQTGEKNEDRTARPNEKISSEQTRFVSPADRSVERRMDLNGDDQQPEERRKIKVMDEDRRENAEERFHAKERRKGEDQLTDECRRGEKQKTLTGEIVQRRIDSEHHGEEKQSSKGEDSADDRENMTIVGKARCTTSDPPVGTEENLFIFDDDVLLFG